MNGTNKTIINTKYILSSVAYVNQVEMSRCYPMVMLFLHVINLKSSPRHSFMNLGHERRMFMRKQEASRNKTHVLPEAKVDPDGREIGYRRQIIIFHTTIP